MLVDLISAFYRRLPIRSGLTRLSFNPVLDRLLDGKTGDAMTQLRDGTPIAVDLTDHDGRILYLFGSNDIKVAETAIALSRPGDVFLDIGANYSTIGLAVAASVGPTGAVHLFEPQQRLAQRVSQAVEAGSKSNVTVHQLGLMDEDGSFAIHTRSNHSGAASFVPIEGDTRFTTSETCIVREIGGYAGPLVRGKPFGVKVDIEGAEPKIMPWLVSQPNLNFVIFEAARNQQMLFDIVKQSGLSLYGLARNVVRLRVTRIDTVEEMGEFHDLLAIRLGSAAPAPKEIDPRKLARSALYRGA